MKRDRIETCRINKQYTYRIPYFHEHVNYNKRKIPKWMKLQNETVPETKVPLYQVLRAGEILLVYLPYIFKSSSSLFSVSVTYKGRFWGYNEVLATASFLSFLVLRVLLVNLDILCFWCPFMCYIVTVSWCSGTQCSKCKPFMRYRFCNMVSERCISGYLSIASHIAWKLTTAQSPSLSFLTCNSCFIQFVHIFIIYLHTTFHTSSASGSWGRNRTFIGLTSWPGEGKKNSSGSLVTAI